MGKKIFGYDRETQKRIRNITREKTAASNVFIAETMLVISLICFAAFVLFITGVLKSEWLFVYIALIIIPIIFIICSAICLIRKGKGKIFQYLFISLLAVFWMSLEILSGYKTKMLLAILVILSLRYYDRIFTFFTYIFSVIASFFSVWCNAYLYSETKMLDLNTVTLTGNYECTFNGNFMDEIIALGPDSSVIFKNSILFVFVPNFIILTVIAGVSFLFMRSNLEAILKAEELAASEANHRAELADMRTKAVLSQVKPHFVYNALSSIAAYCTDNPEKAQELTLDFSDYLRNNLDSLNGHNSMFCSFETELTHVRSYLNIEKCRFESKLIIEYNITVKNFEVPTLCVQPIVENAVKHGICKKQGSGTVKIATAETEEAFIITVSDDGVGFDLEKIKNDGKVHIGIQNVEQRLGLAGGKLELESTEGIGTVVRLIIPKRSGLV